MELKNRYKGGRPAFDWSSRGTKAYKEFCEKFPQFTISFKDYVKIILEINNQYVQHIVNTGDIVKLPNGLGDLTVSKKNYSRYIHNKLTDMMMSNMKVDWGTTMEKEIDEVTYHLNDHSEGYRFKWFWIKLQAKIKMKHIWVFTPSKKTKYLLRDVVRDKERDTWQFYKEFDTDTDVRNYSY